jgi:hypothetical protein
VVGTHAQAAKRDGDCCREGRACTVLVALTSAPFSTRRWRGVPPEKFASLLCAAESAPARRPWSFVDRLSNAAGACACARAGQEDDYAAVVARAGGGDAAMRAPRERRMCASAGTMGRPWGRGCR